MGAGRSRLIAMVVGESLRPVAAGLAVGLGAALAVGSAAGGLLYGVSARDPLTLGGCLVLLAAVAGLAALLPAWRAARIDPMEALRGS